MKLDRNLNIWYGHLEGTRRVALSGVSYVTVVEGDCQNFYRLAGHRQLYSGYPVSGESPAHTFRANETRYTASSSSQHGPRGAP